MTQKTSLAVLLTLLVVGIAAAQPMSGLYTVKKDGTGDFTSVYAAGQALSSRYTNGNVVIEISEGVYNDGYIYLYYVNQSRPQDTITFRPATGAKVTIGNGGSSYVFYSYYTNNVKVEDMEITCSSSYGFYLQYCSGWKVQRCKISAQSYGMRVYSGCNYDSIIGNEITVTSSYGLYLYNSSYAYGHYIVNNIIKGWTSYGIYAYYGYYWKVVNNTFEGSGSYAMCQYYQYGDTLKNNIFKGSSYGIYRYSGDALPAYANYNCYWTGSVGATIFYSSSYGALTLTGLQGYGREGQGINQNPLTGGVMNPHLRTGSPCISAGNPWPGITVDIDGDSRDGSTPDIGADEYTSVGSAMSGTYYIKPGILNGDTFPSFARANSDMAIRGRSGDVTFEVFGGSYAENIDLTGLERTPYWLNYIAHLSSGVPDEVNVSASGSYAVTMRGAKRVRFRNINVSGASYAFYLYYDQSTSPYTPCDTIVIQGCRASGNSYAIYAYNYYGGSDDSIYNNYLSAGSSYGIYWYGSSSYPGYRAYFANNTITGWTSYGIYMYYPYYPKFIYNTFVGSGSYGVYGNYMYGDTWQNNIFQANTYGMARYYGDALPAYSNNNCFWTNAGAGGTCIYASSYGALTLAAWKGYGRDANSINQNPMTGAPINPHLKAGSPCIDSGAAYAGVTRDIDGDARDTLSRPPDIGADEFTSVGSPMSGVFTVKQAGGGDYRSLMAGLGDLALRGFGGDLQFDVYDGTYNGSYNLQGIGNGANKLTFRAYPGQTAILQAAGRYNWYLWANKRIRIEGFTMRGATSYPIYMYYNSAVSPYDGCDTCVIRGNTMSGGSYGIYSYYGDDDTFDLNTISGVSSYGMYIYGYYNYGQYSQRNVVTNNSITAPYGLMSYCQDSLKFSGNTVNAQYYPFYDYAGDAHIITNNYLNTSGTSYYGMYINGYYSSPYSRNFVIANNMISGAYYGIYLQYTAGAQLIHNSLQPNATGYYGLYSYYNYGLVMKNNIFNTGTGGYALYYYYGDVYPAESDYNDFWVNGGSPYVIYHYNYGSMDLATWRTYSGKDANSINVDPGYKSLTDDHLQGSSGCINKGTYLSGYQYDFDGDDRARDTADIGADEYFGDFAVRAIISPANPAYPIGATITPEAAFKHLGGPRQTYYVGMSIFKGAAEVYRDSVLRTTKAGDSLDVTFADWVASPGGTDYVAWAWHTFAGDMVPDNDTASKAFVVGTIDIALTKITTPVGSYDTSAVIKPAVYVKNNGTLNPGAFWVYFQIDSTPGNTCFFDSAQVPSLNAGDSLLTVAAEWAKPHKARSYTITDWLSVAYDTSAANDTIKGTFTLTSKQPGWYLMAPMPAAGKPPKDGAWIAYDAGGTLDAGTGLIYASVGNKQPNFFSYSPIANSWKALAPWLPGVEAKLPQKGSDGCADGNGHIYATKGNNTVGFWQYTAKPDSAGVWAQKKDVPLGVSNKRVKGGTGIAWAYKGAVGAPYLLKGYKNEFYRYNVDGDSWSTLTPAPVGAREKWDKGSWLAYDDVNKKIYAFKAKYMEFYRFSPDGDSWSAALAPMPITGSTGNKKAKAGSSGAFFNGSIYALKGGNTQQFFKYTIATNSWTEIDTFPRGTEKKKANAGSDIATAGMSLYALKGNKCQQFWQYVPSGAYLFEPPRRDGVLASQTEIVEGVSISPNPLASGFAVLRYGLPKAGAANLIVYNVAGQVVMTRTLAAGRSGSVSLDLRHLSNGVYLAKFSSEGFSSSQKLVVQR